MLFLVFKKYISMHLLALFFILCVIIVLSDDPKMNSTCDVAQLNPNFDREFIDSQLYFLTSCNCSEQLSLAPKNLKSYKINSTQWDPYIPLSQWDGGENNEVCWKLVDRHFAFDFCGVSGALEINHAWAVLKDCHESPKQQVCIFKFVETLNDIAESNTTKPFCRRYYHYIKNRLIKMNVPLEYSEGFMLLNYARILKALETVESTHQLAFSLAEMRFGTLIACYEVKRAVSACAVEFFVCHTMFTNVNCTEKHDNCLTKSMASDDCKSAITSDSSDTTVYTAWDTTWDTEWDKLESIIAFLVIIEAIVVVGIVGYLLLKTRTKMIPWKFENRC